MSERYPGGIITKSPVTPAGPFAEGSAPGVWTLEQQAYWQAQGLWPNANNPTPNDPQFQYVTSLLNGNGVNGAQNSTFLDSSSNNFTVTRNGNTTQGSFSPYDPNWGNFFNGTDSSISVTSASAFDFSGDFTAEGWFNFSQIGQTAGETVLFSSNTVDRFQLALSSTAFTFRLNGSLIVNASFTTSSLIGNWSHIAAIRTGSTVAIFVNGIRIGSGTSSASIDNGVLYIGQQTPGFSNHWLSGYASNVRVINGSGPYNATQSTLTVPTTPLTAIANTSLLTCQSNRFIDNSSNNFTITLSGSPQVTSFSPFPATYSTQYSTSLYGGSGFFDGAGDYLTVNPSSTTPFAMGTGDFTLEFWYYPTTILSGVRTFYDPRPASTDAIVPNVYMNGGQLFYIVGSSDVITGPTLTAGQWYHIVICRSGTSTRMFVNGVQGGSTYTDTNDYVAYSNRPLIFANTYNLTANNPEGYCGGLRLVKGTALYTSTFTPPTTPLTAISGTSLLLSFTNAAISDKSMTNDIETVSSARVSTSVKKYGNSSIHLDAGGSYLRSATVGQTTAFGTENFTIECWIYVNNEDTIQYIYDGRSSATTNVAPSIYIDASNLLIYQTAATTRITGPRIQMYTWYHIAVSRAGGFTKMFVNGTQVGSTYTDSNNYLGYNNRPIIGATYAGATQVNAYVEDFRITKGYARYWENFTPPAAALPSFGGAPQIPAQDPQFDYTTLLLPGNGTNGAQNNTFLDSSTNNFTITRNGNTTQGTFSPFSQTGWSGFFNGTNQYCTLSSNASMDFGTGDFTIEAWVYTGTFSVSGGASRTIIGNSGNSFTMQLYIDTTSGRLVFGNTGSTFVQGSTSIANNQWMHVAVSRSGTTARLFVNGNLEASGSNSQNYTSGTIYLGSFDTGNGFWNGYISNLRIVKGTALYTSNFTPSTTPLTAVSNTALLTFQSNRFLDNSTNAYTVTAVNSPSVQPFSPFNPTSTYSTSVVGGSGYFAGDGNYLTSTLTGQSIGSGNFTIECWAYHNNFTGDPGLFQIGPSTTPNNSGVGVFIKNVTGEPSLVYDGNFTVGSIALRLNSWNHIAVVRSGSTITLYVNGVSSASVSNSTNYSDTTLLLGAYYSASVYGMNGYISGFRYVKGTAVYTGAFTPPTAPPTAIANTQLLCNFTNAGIIDATADNVLETVGNAQISTAQSKFGGSSMYFDGTGDGLALPASNQWNFSSGDWTIEGWVYPTSLSGDHILVENTTDGTGGLSVQLFGSAFGVYINSTAINAGTFTVNTWQHFALVRYGSTMTAYINGLPVGTSSTTPGSGAAGLWIGARSGGGNSLAGYLQDLRITKGYARYVQPFTPPTQAFQLY